MNLKIFGFTALSALALAAIGAGTASATSLEVTGTPTTPVTITANLGPNSSVVLSSTASTHQNTCKKSHAQGTMVDSGSSVTGALSALSFTECQVEKVVVHKPGQLFIEHYPFTTNGTVWSENAEITVPTTLGFTVNCKTGAGTDIGTLTGSASGSATLHVNAVLNCGFLVPSANWQGTYTVATPHGLGVVI